MQNASIIRYHGEHLRLYNHTLHECTNLDSKYIDIFRNEMEEFRELFIDWIKQVKAMEDDFGDEWGLFVTGA